MRLALLGLAMIAGMLQATLDPPLKWLVGKHDKVLGKLNGTVFVSCGGARVDISGFPNAKLDDAPNMFCPPDSNVAYKPDGGSSDGASADFSRARAILLESSAPDDPQR